MHARLVTHARLGTVVVIISLLPAAGGCGTIRNILYNRGAACGPCAATAPNYNVPAPRFGTPNFGRPNCGRPGYGAPAYNEPGCGGPGYREPTCGGPTYASPTYGGSAQGCGAPQCGVVYGDQCGCGGEAGGSYYGGYGYGDARYPGRSSIGAPMIGNGIYGGSPNNSYIPENGWMPTDPNMVPGSATYSDGTSAGNMIPVPRPN